MRDSRLTILLADTGAYQAKVDTGDPPSGEVSLLLTCEVLQDDQPGSASRDGKMGLGKVPSPYRGGVGAGISLVPVPQL